MTPVLLIDVAPEMEVGFIREPYPRRIQCTLFNLLNHYVGLKKSFDIMVSQLLVQLDLVGVKVIFVSDDVLQI